MHLYNMRNLLRRKIEIVESNIHTNRVGQQVGDYRLLRLLGGGGFGEVYLAEHMRNHSQAAVKILQARLTGGEELKAFINEARTFRLKHPHIIPLLDFGIAFEDVPYLVMEYAPQGTLRERHPAGTQVPLPTVVSYVNQVASALQCAHDLYLIHRDVKPENMLVGANGEILLTDFGIAAVAHNSYTLNRQQEGIGGTVAYMAPEQIEGRPRPASDQYALGILVYEWLSGKRPFQGTPTEVMMQHIAAPPTSFSQLTPLISPEVELVVFTALAKDPGKRFGSIQAFATALTQASQRHQPFPPSMQSSYPTLLPSPSEQSPYSTLPPSPSGQSRYPTPSSSPSLQPQYSPPPPPSSAQSSYSSRHHRRRRNRRIHILLLLSHRCFYLWKTRPRLHLPLLRYLPMVSAFLIQHLLRRGGMRSCLNDLGAKVGPGDASC